MTIEELKKKKQQPVPGEEPQYSIGLPTKPNLFAPGGVGSRFGLGQQGAGPGPSLEQPGAGGSGGNFLDQLIQGVSGGSSPDAGGGSFNIDQLIQENLFNPYAQKMGDWFNQVLSPEYQAYSPEYKQQLYDTRSQGLIEDVFKPQEERFAARLATSGLAGSGVAADQWSNQVKKNEDRILADLMSGIEQENISLTREDQAQAQAMFPALNPLSDLFSYKGLLSQDEAQRQEQAYRQDVLGLQRDDQAFSHNYQQSLLDLQRAAQAFEQAYKQGDQEFSQGYQQSLLDLQRAAQTFEQAYKQDVLGLQREGQTFEQGYKQDLLGLQREDQAFSQQYQQSLLDFQKASQEFEQLYKQDLLGLQRDDQAFQQRYQEALLELQRTSQAFQQAQQQAEFDYQQRKDRSSGVGGFLGGLLGMIPGVGGALGGLLGGLFG